MATYIQGVQDYIPQPQLFKPDYEFLSTVLETRQGRYDQNYKELNSLYNTLRYGDLTREDTTQRRDSFMNLADVEVKKAAGLDLSLEQNIESVKSIFSPFWEDDLLVTDLGRTRSYKNQMMSVQGYMNSPVKQVREQYWDTGVKAMNYQMEEFKMAAPDEAVRMGARVQYVPSMNLAAMAQAIYKKNGYDVVRTASNGRFIVKAKNGQMITPMVTEDLMRELSADPGVSAMFETQAYVAQKDFGVANEQVFGDRVSAELAWADSVIATMGPEALKNSRKVKGFQQDLEERIAQAENNIRTRGVVPGSSEDLEYKNYLRQQAGLEPIVEAASQISETVTSPSENAQQTIAKARAIYSNMGMYSQISSIAQSLAMKDSAQEITGADPYALEEQRHNNSLIEGAYKSWWDYQSETALAHLKGMGLELDTQVPGSFDQPIQGDSTPVQEDTGYNQNVKTYNQLYQQVSGADEQIINSFISSAQNPTKNDRGISAIRIKDKDGNYVTLTAPELRKVIEKERKENNGVSLTLNRAVDTLLDDYGQGEAGKKIMVTYGDQQLSLTSAFARRQLDREVLNVAARELHSDNAAKLEQVLLNLSPTQGGKTAGDVLREWEKENVNVQNVGYGRTAIVKTLKNPTAENSETWKKLKYAAEKSVRVDSNAGNQELVSYMPYFSTKTSDGGTRILPEQSSIAKFLRSKGYSNDEIVQMHQGNFESREAASLYKDAKNNYQALRKEFNAVYDSSTSSFNLQARMEGKQELGSGNIISPSLTYVYNAASSESRQRATTLLSQINMQRDSAIITTAGSSKANPNALKFYNALLPNLLVGPASDPKKGGNPFYSITYNRYNNTKGLEGYSQYTIRLTDEDMIKKYVGTEDNPGILYGQEDLIQNGIQINIPRLSDNTVVARAQSKIDPVLSLMNATTPVTTQTGGGEFTYGGGSLKFSTPNGGWMQYVDQGGMVHFMGSLVNFDTNGVPRESQPVSGMIPNEPGVVLNHFNQAFSGLQINQKMINDKLEELHQNNQNKVYDPKLLTE